MRQFTISAAAATAFVACWSGFRHRLTASVALHQKMEVSALNFRQRLALGTRGGATGAPVRRPRAPLLLRPPGRPAGIAPRHVKGRLPPSA